MSASRIDPDTCQPFEVAAGEANTSDPVSDYTCVISGPQTGVCNTPTLEGVPA